MAGCGQAGLLDTHPVKLWSSFKVYLQPFFEEHWNREDAFVLYSPGGKPAPFFCAQLHEHDAAAGAGGCGLMAVQLRCNGGQGVADARACPCWTGLRARRRQSYERTAQRKGEKREREREREREKAEEKTNKLL